MKDSKNNKKDVRNEIRKIESRFEILRTLIAISISLAIIVIIVAIVSDDPINSIITLLTGPLTSVRRFANVIELMIPLAFCGLALTFVFSTKRFNLSSDSAFYLGAMVACIIGVFSNLPPVLSVILSLIAGFLVGALVGFIPAILSEKFHAEVLVLSLMLNYIVGFLVKYLFSYVVRDPGKAAQQSYPLPKGVNLGTLIPGTRIHAGLFLMLIAVFIVYTVFYKTKWGYTLRMVGMNEKFAKYTGKDVSKIVILAQVIGTGIAGFGGSVEMLGVYKSFMWAQSPGYGFDGVIIATLAHENPKNIPLAAFFLAYIRVGADILNRTSNIPAEIISIVQATIILLIAAQAFLSKWKEREIIKVSEIENNNEVIE
jgi:ABC-type uncharacterized transport system permease subunit